MELRRHKKGETAPGRTRETEQNFENGGTKILSFWRFCSPGLPGRLTLLSHTNITETLVAVRDLPAGAYLENDGLVVMEAENGTRSNGLTHNWLLKTTLPGYTGTSYL